jgi:DNA integrity scanning protein DisA with diadenylate cyclase activity
MNTSSKVTDLLNQSLTSAREAERTVSDLIAVHDYQDVATLVTQAAIALLESAALLMQSEAEAAFDQMEKAEDLLDSVYTIIDGEIDEE